MSRADEHVDAKLVDYAYGELSPAEKSSVEIHLGQCTRCAKTLSEIQGVRRAMSKLPVEDAPTEGLESLLMYARNSRRRVSTSRSWMRWLVPVGAGLAVAMFGLVSQRMSERSGARLALKTGQRESVSAEDKPPARVYANEFETAAPEPKTTGPQSSRRSEEASGLRRSGENTSGLHRAGETSAREELAYGPEKPPVAGGQAESGGRRAVKLQSPASDQVRPSPASSKDSEPRAGIAAGSPASAAPEVRLSQNKSAFEASRWETKAAEARGAGDRRMEATYLRRAIAINEDRSALPRLLGQLCEADRFLGSAPDVRASCGRLVQEFPQSPEAKSAETALRELPP